MNRSKSGQAMLEFICGLVGVVVVISMLLQINMISREHIFSVVRARGEMADELTDGWHSPASAPFLSDWETGPDGHDYSEDDIQKAGSAGNFQSSLWEAINGDELQVWIPSSRMTDVCDAFSAGIVGTFELVMIEDEFAQPVEVLPMLRRMVYDQEEIDIKHRIYMPLINNIMN